MTNKLSPKEKIVAARTQLLLQRPFYGHIALSLNLTKTDDPNIPVMGTDGEQLYVNEKGIGGLTKGDLQFIVAHECLHVMFLHMTRRNGRNPELWNMAGDYVINYALVDEGLRMPEEGLYDKNYGGMSTEQVYEFLKKENQQQQQQNSNIDGQQSGTPSWDFGSVQDAKSKDDTKQAKAKVKQLEAKVKASIQNAMAAAKKAGKLPGQATRNLITDILEPKANLADRLSEFVSRNVFSDYDFGTCSTRHLKQYGIISPKLSSPALDNVTLIIDVSGSVSDKELQQFAGEIKDIVSRYPDTSINVIYCDTEIKQVNTYDDPKDLELYSMGRGGTMMKPAFDKLEKDFSDSSCVILFSDSELFDWDKIDEPSMPALMVCSSSVPAADVPDWIETVVVG